MKTSLIVQWGVCIVLLSVGFFSLVFLQNRITKLQIALRKETQVVQVLEENCTQLRYEVAQWENPQHLLELLSRAEYSHLKHPKTENILVIQPESERVCDIPKRGGDAPFSRVILGSR